MGDKPVNFVCRFDAVRFANWVTNGKGDGATETGPYTITGGGPNAGVVTDPIHAELTSGPLTYVLPTEDEWYKAAYYQGGSTTGAYWTYATQCNTPQPKEAHLDAEGNIDGYFTTGTSGEVTSPVGDVAVLNNYQNRLCTVGSAGAASQSFYGTMNQDDNVTELVENTHEQNGTRETVMGSSTFYGMEVHGWYFASLRLTHEQEDFGFRLAALGIPEAPPSNLALQVATTAANLGFTWNSHSGKLYRLWSSPSLASPPPTGWTLVQDNIPADAPSLQIPRPAEPNMFFVLEEYAPPPAVVFSDNFDAAATGWTTGVDQGTQTAWELGTPTNVGPLAASSPPNCYGTNIHSVYGLDADVWLRSPAIDLTAFTTGSVQFKQFKDIEAGYDFGSVRILAADDGAVLGVLQTTVDGTTSDWEDYSKALPSAAFTEPIQIEFRLQTDDYDNVPYAGWYLDDFVIMAAGS